MSAIDAVRMELCSHPKGVSALQLADKVMEQGFSQRVVEQAIRRAIDDGSIKTGPDLELIPNRPNR